AGSRYDQLNYDDKMHFALLDDKNGVSLERIDYNRASNERTNWTSASAASGYGTPTRKNSQYMQSNAGRSLLSLSSEIFSPDGDGYQDLLNIYIKTPATGYTGTLSVYDNNGRLVKQLMRNDILGAENIISWDGINDNGEKANIGIYIIYLEVFDLKGNTTKEKITAVVGARL
ncbi:MAG: gliding motility-associated C-terminal domain-containing protein, partial [Bacteroidota bacterium]